MSRPRSEIFGLVPLSAAAVRTLTCPRCLAGPGRRCQNEFGRRIGNHLDRVRAADDGREALTA